MRTTLDIDDGLLIQAKQFAAGNRTSLTRLIEEGLSLRLQAAQAVTSDRARCALPVYAGQGGLQPTIKNTLSQRALLDAIDEADAVR
ncbi:hypothetical protein [Ferrovum sp.]|uniref:hypothetical protein n=1 Tax=Ferrovum sp. TaxID=2609467 RepID=UPI002608DC68|nr:hypothetical protein [Ferrovum sp.]